MRSLHKSYYDAGSNIVSANTFGANSLKFSEEELEEIVREAIAHVKQAAKESQAKQEKWVALDIATEAWSVDEGITLVRVKLKLPLDLA